MHRAQGQWYAGYFSLHHDEEQKEYHGKIGTEEVQSDPEESDSTQRNQIIRIIHGKENSSKFARRF